MINQLFSTYVDDVLFNKVLNIFKIDLNNPVPFSKYDFNHEEVIDKMNQLKPELQKLYINSKSFYINNIRSFRRCITVLRQILALRKIPIFFTQKYQENKQKIIYYYVNCNISVKNKKTRLKVIHKPMVVYF
jgi:hypothetical protein